MTRIGRIFGAAGAVSLMRASLAFAQASGAPQTPFASPPDGDKALAWVNFLFNGDALPDSMDAYGQSLATLAEGLRHALGIYNTGMLTIGALLLFYHISCMIVDTAHSGVALGRRANKIWGPIRLIFALVLLVPVADGLSAGQYVIVKLAKLGSGMASAAWANIAGYVGDNFTQVVAPQPPNLAALAERAVEMELCRAVYQQVYAQMAAQFAHDGTDSPGLQLAGTIQDVAKLPANVLGPETWRYSNSLNAPSPLCGEYRFTGYRPYGLSTGDAQGNTASAAERASSALFAFAHLETEGILTAASGLAGRIAPALLTPSAAPGGEIRGDFAGFVSDLQNHLDAKIKTTEVAGARAAAQIVSQSTEAGWLAAADIVPELMRLQENYGDMIARALPATSEPLLDHATLARQAMFDALGAHLPLASPQADSTRQMDISVLYNQVSHVMAGAHAWLIETQMPKGAFVPASTLDLREHLNIATDSSSAFGMFASAFDAEAIADGVWGRSPDMHDGGTPFAAGQPSPNPLMMLAEFGRRQYRLGTYILGLCGSALGSPGAIAPAALTAAAALATLLGGLGLVFAVPFLPFFRFAIGILTWILNLFEAVVAMPVVALAHLTPAGDGLSGGAAREAYRLWLSLMIRPLLTLLGFALGFMVFSAAIGIFTAAFSPFARLSAVSNDGLAIVSNIALVLLFDVFAYAAANASFKGIGWLPEQALRWISAFTVTESAEVEPAAATPTHMQSLTHTFTAPAASLPSTPAAHISSGTGGNITTATRVAETGAASGTASAKSSNLMKSNMFPSYQGGGGTNGPPITLNTPNVTVKVQNRDKSSPPQSGARTPNLPPTTDKLARMAPDLEPLKQGNDAKDDPTGKTKADEPEKDEPPEGGR